MVGPKSILGDRISASLRRSISSLLFARSFVDIESACELRKEVNDSW